MDYKESRTREKKPKELSSAWLTESYKKRKDTENTTNKRMRSKLERTTKPTDKTLSIRIAPAFISETHKSF